MSTATPVKPTNQHQGEALKDIIDRSGVSIEDLAKRLNIDRRTIYLWCSKEVVPVKNVDRIGNALKIDMYKAKPGVFGGSDYKQVEVPAKREGDAPIADYWKDQYLDQMKQGLKLSEEILKLKDSNNKLQVENMQQQVTIDKLKAELAKLKS